MDKVHFTMFVTEITILVVDSINWLLLLVSFRCCICLVILRKKFLMVLRGVKPCFMQLIPNCVTRVFVENRGDIFYLK
jgi:hypothetical protein